MRRIAAFKKICINELARELEVKAHEIWTGFRTGRHWKRNVPSSIDEDVAPLRRLYGFDTPESWTTSDRAGRNAQSRMKNTRRTARRKSRKRAIRRHRQPGPSPRAPLRRPLRFPGKASRKSPRRGTLHLPSRFVRRSLAGRFIRPSEVMLAFRRPGPPNPRRPRLCPRRKRLHIRNRRCRLPR